MRRLYHHHRGSSARARPKHILVEQSAGDDLTKHTFFGHRKDRDDRSCRKRSFPAYSSQAGVFGNVPRRARQGAHCCSGSAMSRLAHTRNNKRGSADRRRAQTCSFEALEELFRMLSNSVLRPGTNGACMSFLLCQPQVSGESPAARARAAVARVTAGP